MNYPFVAHQFDWLTIHESKAAPGMVHLKQFQSDTAPSKQRTLNLYVSGKFGLSVGQYEQVMLPGQSSQDVRCIFPHGLIVIEEPLEEGVRLCLAPKDEKQAWSRRAVQLAAGESITAEPGGLVVIATSPPTAAPAFTADTAQTVWLVKLEN
jgi:hypothetical protein